MSILVAKRCLLIVVVVILSSLNMFNSGEVKSIEGSAFIFAPGRFKVGFFPFIKSDYNVLYVDEFYSYALVGGGSPRFLWILSRTPELDGRVINGLLDRAEKQGYKVDNFVLDD